jgi:hypothetical protein
MINALPQVKNYCKSYPIAQKNNVRGVTQCSNVSGCSIGIIPLDYGQSGCADYVVLQEFDVGECCVGY